RDRQPSDGRRANGDAADRTRDLECRDAARRRAPAPHPVHPRTGQVGAGLKAHASFLARRVEPTRLARSPNPAAASGRSMMQRRAWIRGVRAASAAAGLMILTLAALAQSPKIGDPPEAKNMRLVGYNDLHGRSAYQPTIHHQGSRYIAYIGHHGGTPEIPQ